MAHILEALCASSASPNEATVVRQSSEALRQVEDFLSKVTEPLSSEEEQRWFIGTLHALDHTIRLAESVDESARIDASLDSPDERRAVKLHADAMQDAAESSASLERLVMSSTEATAAKPAEAIQRLARSSRELADLRREHRRATLDSVGAGKLTAGTAIANVDAVRLLDQQVHHVDSQRALSSALVVM